MKIFPSTFFEENIECYLQEISLKGQFVFSSILIFLFCCAVSLPFIYVDTFTQSRGIIKARQEKYQIKAPLSGEIIFMNLRENQKVEKGDTLMVLDYSIIDAEIDVKQCNIDRIDRYVTDINSLLKIYKLGKPQKNILKTRLFQKEYKLFLKKINELNLLLELSKNELKRKKKLFEKGLIARSEYEKTKYELDRAISQKEQFYEGSILDWEKKIKQHEIEKNIQNVDLKKMYQHKKNCFVLAPIKGTIQELQGFQHNSFVFQNQIISKITPDDSLIAEVYVLPRSIGFLRIGQAVNIQIDAYNYREWGGLKGKVFDISDDVVIYRDAYFFKIICKFENKYLKLNSGFKGELKKGMTLTANFQYNRRSLYSLLFDKIDDWVNPQVKK